MAELGGQVALVTGGSRGIGKAICERLAADGARVAVVGRDGARAQAVAAMLAGTGHQGYACDVADSRAVDALVKQVEQELGGIDILINNAGVTADNLLVRIDDEAWQKVLDTNLKGAWLAAREFAHHLVEQKRPGRIVNISSILGFRTIGRVPAYCAAKAGLTHLTHVLAMELARYGILVNALAPGYVETDLNREFLRSPAGEAMVKRVALRRFGRPSDLDGALLLLASDAGAYLTGTTIVVWPGQEALLDRYQNYIIEVGEA